MARDFSGSGQYLTAEASPVSGYPFTLACWAYSDGTGTVFAVGDKDTASHYDSLAIASATQAWAASSDSGGVNVSESTSWSHGTWHHIAGVFASSTSRQIFVNGTSASASTTSRTPNARDRIGVAVRPDSGLSTLFDGRVAEAGIWDIALSGTQITTLATLGTIPRDVQAADLVAYWPILGVESPEPDEIGSAHLVLTGSPLWISHPFTRTERRYRRLYGPAQLGTSATDLYTVPGNVRTRVRRIYANNPTGSPVTVTAQVGGNPVVEVVIPAGESYPWAEDLPLEAGETLQGYASTGSAVVLIIDGVEEAI